MGLEKDMQPEDLQENDKPEEWVTRKEDELPKPCPKGFESLN
tara:strand:+ start:238 stop:363 length:126 start_codon:yes stop_codon:yes gene_type:complete